MSTSKRLKQLREATEKYRETLRAFLGEERYGVYRYIENWMRRKELDRRYFVTGASLLAFGQILEAKATEREEAAARELVAIKLAIAQSRHGEAAQQARGLIGAIQLVGLPAGFSRVTVAAASAVLRDCGTPIANSSDHAVAEALGRLRELSADAIWRHKDLGDTLALSADLVFHSNLHRAYLNRVSWASVTEAESLAELALKYTRLGQKHHPARLLAEYQATLRKLTLRLWYRQRAIHEGLKNLEELAAEINVPSLWAEYLILRAGQLFLIDGNLDGSRQLLLKAENQLQGQGLSVLLWFRLWRQHIQVLRRTGKFEEAREIADKFSTRLPENPCVYQASSLPLQLKSPGRMPYRPTVGATLPGFYSADVLERTSEGLLPQGIIDIS